MKRWTGFVVLSALILALATVGAHAADDRPPTGALYGTVLDTSGKAVPGATVALQDKKGGIIAWTKTDDQGRYAFAADTLKVLDLRPSRRQGMLARIAGGVGKVIIAPVKLVGDVVEGAAGAVAHMDPARTAKAAVISGVTANPGPIATQVADGAARSVSDNAQKKAREAAARTVLGERQQAAANDKDKKIEKLVPGEVRIAVSAPGFKDIRGKAGAWWLEPVAADKDERRERGARAWLEPVRLAPASAPADKKSEIENIAILLAEPSLEPALLPAGATVPIRVKLKAPAGTPLNVRVFAREDKKGAVAELRRLPESPDVFAGELTLDPKTPIGDTVVSLVALRAEPLEVDLKSAKTDPMLAFVRELDDLQPNKPYAFDPRIMASENRIDLSITILDPRHSTPAPPIVAPKTP